MSEEDEQLSSGEDESDYAETRGEQEQESQEQDSPRPAPPLDGWPEFTPEEEEEWQKAQQREPKPERPQSDESDSRSPQRDVPRDYWGDASRQPRTNEHDWRGKLFIGLTWAGFWITVLGGIPLTAFACDEYNAAGGSLALIVFAALAGFQYWFVRAVRDFDRRGWYVLAVLLPLSGVGYILQMPGDFAGFIVAFCGFLLTIAWIDYFWTCREKYGIGAD